MTDQFRYFARLFAGPVLGVLTGLAFMLAHHLSDPIHPADQWSYFGAYGGIGAIAGSIGGALWACASVKHPDE